LPSGLRRITPPMLKTMKAADAFRGVPGLLPGHVLAAFKAAAPFLGLRSSVIHAIDWLFRFTQAIDWEPGSRPVVWPSAAEQRAAFGLSAAQVKSLNRQLAELGLVIMRDSPNGKRYGVRKHGRTGPIVEAYGFDLSPLAARFADFRAIAAEGKARQGRMKALRRRASIARNGLRQLLAAAAAEPAAGCDLAAWKLSAAPLGLGLADIIDEGVLAMAVAGLERVRDEAQVALEKYISGPFAQVDPVETGPKGSGNQPHITTTNELLNPPDTVVAGEGGGREGGMGIGLMAGCSHGRTQAAAARGPREPDKANCLHDVRQEGKVLNLTPQQLTRLAPKLRLYLPQTTATWPDIVNAADWLRGDLGISKSLWGDACLTLGRMHTAVAVALVSAKREGHFRTSPGAYFCGMVRRARTGELNLDKTIWGLRAQLQEGPPIRKH
jgi:replication initiation protein RepC